MNEIKTALPHKNEFEAIRITEKRCLRRMLERIEAVTIPFQSV